MKAEKLIKLLAVTLILASAAIGCKKGLQGTTPLPGYKVGSISERPQGPKMSDVPPSPPTTPPDTVAKSNEMPPPSVPTTGIEPNPGGSHEGWIQDRKAFEAQTVYFEFDKATIKSSEISKLEAVASQMKSSYQGKALLVEGHCDERGTEEYNRALGERRALAVREFLVRLGMDPATVDTISFGEDRPADPAHNEAAWSKNRRGQIVLLSPPTGPVAGGSNP